MPRSVPCGRARHAGEADEATANAMTRGMRRRTKPLADCTNTINPVSPLSPSSSPKPPPKPKPPPAASAASANQSKKSSSPHQYAFNPNHPPNPTTIHSRLHRSPKNASPPSGTIECVSFEPPRAKTDEERQATHKIKDKEKTVATTVAAEPTNAKDPLSANPPQQHSVLEDNSGNIDFSTCETLIANDETQSTIKTKDKGKAVLIPVEPLNIQDPSTSQQQPHIPGNHGNIDFSTCETLGADDERQSMIKRKDKGKAVLIHVEPFNIQDPSTSQRPHILDSTGNIDFFTCETLRAYDERQSMIKRKDKGKAVLIHVEPFNIQDPSTSPQPHISPGNIDFFTCETLRAYDEGQSMIKRKDKGKAVLINAEPFNIQDPSTSQQPHILDSHGTIDRETFEPLKTHDERHSKMKIKDKRKAASLFVLPSNSEDPSTQRRPDVPEAPGTIDRETFGPPKAHDERHSKMKIKDKRKAASLLGLLSNSEDPYTPQWKPDVPETPGTDSCEVIKCLTVYSRRRPAQKRKLKGKMTAIPLTDPPVERINRIGENFKKALGEIGHSKSWPLPQQKAKKKRKERGSTGFLPHDYIEQQRAYFAEIDADILMEEDATSSDLEDHFTYGTRNRKKKQNTRELEEQQKLQQPWAQGDDQRILEDQT